MVRIAREFLALVSVASFVWMMCQVAQLVAWSRVGHEVR